MKATVSPLRKPVKAEGLRVPGDKSISHRALLFAALAEGESRIAGLAPGGDVRSTARCLPLSVDGFMAAGDCGMAESRAISAWVHMPLR